MAEVRRMLGKMQLDTEGGSVKMQLETEGGSVQVSYETRDKIVGSFAGEIGVTKAVLGNEEVTSRFTREIPKEATRRFTREIDVPKAEQLLMEPAGSTPEIGVCKTGVHKDAIRGSTSGFFVTKAQPLNKEVAGSTRGIGVTKAATGTSTPKIGVTKAATGTSTPKIGVTKAATGTSTPKIGVTKAAAGSSTPKIGVTKAAAGSSTPKIGVTKAAAGSSTPEIGVTKAASYISGSDLGITKAFLDKHLLKTGTGTGLGLTAEPNLRAWLYKFAEGNVKLKEGSRFEPVVPPATVTRVRVPDAFIESIKKHPMRKIRPLHPSIAKDNPKRREFLLDSSANIAYMVDLQQDCLRQYEEKGYAEIGVDYTDDGLQKVYILPESVVEVEGN